MASFFSSVRQGFGRQANKSPNPQQQAERLLGSGHPSLQQINTAPYAASNTPPPQTSPSLQPNHMAAPGQQPLDSNRKPPYFFRDDYSGLIVKGNFMTLATRPTLVEKGEWLAHQVVEQYRLLDSMCSIIRVEDERTRKPICNPECCPTMSASGHTYTWLDNQKRPIKIPACQYIQLVQKWIGGKISDTTLFPTDSTNIFPQPYPPGGSNMGATPIAAGPTNLNAPLSDLAGRNWVGKESGFPENFEQDIKSIYRQMMRCYAHIYHGHWLTPFWDVNAYRELNTCFIHFVNVGMTYNLINEKEMEPMQPLIDIWIRKELLANPAKTQAVETSQQSQQAQQAQLNPGQIPLAQTQSQHSNPNQPQSQYYQQQTQQQAQQIQQQQQQQQPMQPQYQMVQNQQGQFQAGQYSGAS